MFSTRFLEQISNVGFSSRFLNPVSLLSPRVVTYWAGLVPVAVGREKHDSESQVQNLDVESLTSSVGTPLRPYGVAYRRADAQATVETRESHQDEHL
jgi:hypothetical protein